MGSGTIKVIEIHSGQTLFETDLHQSDKAHSYARDMEMHGLEVRIETPSLPETLGFSLGVSAEEQLALKEELQLEIDQHDSICGSCTSIKK